MTRFSDPLVDAFAAAGLAAGHKTTPDYNGAQQEGFGVWQMTVRDGRRCSAADAYLRPALARDNLTVEIDALATRLVFDGKAAHSARPWLGLNAISLAVEALAQRHRQGLRFVGIPTSQRTAAQATAANSIKCDPRLACPLHFDPARGRQRSLPA